MLHRKNIRNSEAGTTMIEALMAGAILVVGSIAMLTLIVSAIATNNRNKMDSTQTMLAASILEQVNSTFNSTGTTSDLTDCAGNSWTINTTIPNTGTAGAALSGTHIDFSETNPPAGYFMNYLVSAPCTSTGTPQGVYDVRWHLDQVGSTKTYLITVSAKLQKHGEGNKFFSLPVTLRFMSGS